jgi:hypothetical protein
MKNALTKNLDDPMLEAMPVRPVQVSDGLTNRRPPRSHDR